MDLGVRDRGDLIVGGTAGIGRAAAQVLAADGARVAVAGRGRERVMAEEWGMKVALGRAGRPDEVGDVIAFLLSERAGYLTGATINVDGGTDF